jgi:pyruvate/2-oxoglutarate dehydrogenase complex dihydrolipoamide acyltransferase (E2) component
VNHITLTGFSSPSVAIDPSAWAARDSAISEARCVGKVCDPLTAELAVVALKSLKDLSRTVEKHRKDIKEPVLNLGRLIDSTAKDFCADLEKEETRITKLLNAYQSEIDRIAREQEEKRQADIRRLQEEERKRQEEAARKEREAKAAQEAAERAAREAVNAEQRKAAIEQARLADEERRRLAAQAAQEAAIARQAEAKAMQPTQAPQRAEGASVQRPWVFDLIDINALYKARPELVELNVKRSEILARIRAGEREIPGVKIYQETKVSVR